MKRFFTAAGLGLIRMLVKAKPKTLRIFRMLTRPFAWIGRIFITALIPVYRAGYIAKRAILDIYQPARGRIMFWLTNRYIVHIAIGCIVAITLFLNLNTQTVRAETFGQKSLMYQLVADQSSQLYEEYVDFEEGTTRAAYRYAPQTAVSSRTLGIVPEALGSVSASLLGGSSLSAANLGASDASIAPRSEIITYTVESGDTLSSIASDFNITLNTLLWANNLSVRSTLQPGKELEILPISGVRHKVASGDTLSRIANKYDVEADEILAFNALADASDLSIGESLIIPGGTVAAPVATRSTSRIFSPSTSGSSSSIAPTTSGSGNMVWPTDLRVITQYYGWAHTGLDIDCHFTHDNYAADDGVVQFVGWKGGYGYTVEINHGNGIVTRYGHHASMYVSAGQQVAKGTPIGRCGTTGRSTGTHLHFEVIAGGGFRNPLEYIR